MECKSVQQIVEGMNEIPAEFKIGGPAGGDEREIFAPAGNSFLIQAEFLIESEDNPDNLVFDSYHMTLFDQGGNPVSFFTSNDEWGVVQLVGAFTTAYRMKNFSN